MCGFSILKVKLNTAFAACVSYFLLKTQPMFSEIVLWVGLCSLQQGGWGELVWLIHNS